MKVLKAKETLLEELRQLWPTLNHFERGKRLIELSNAGVSKRGLGRSLGVDDGTVRRDIEIALLPEAEQQAIVNGTSATAILSRVRQEKDRERLLRLGGIEGDTHEVSTRLAQLIVAFLGLEVPPYLWQGVLKDGEDQLSSIRLSYSVSVA